MSSKAIYNFFFAVCGNGVFKCKSCDTTRTGYSNLMSHLVAKHPDHAEIFSASQHPLSGTLAQHGFVDEKTRRRWRSTSGWRELSCATMLLLKSTTYLPDRCRVSKRSQSKTLLSYIIHVSKNVGTKLASRMGDCFGLMFDGWTCGPMRFVVIYAVYTKNEEREQQLLAISPAEDGQTADAHIEMIENVIGVYRKRLDMI